MKKLFLFLLLLTCFSCGILDFDTNKNQDGDRFYFGIGAHAEKVVPHQDGSYIYVGITRENLSGNSPYKPFLRKETNTGAEQWTKTYSIPTNSRGIDLIKSLDGNFLIAGTSVPDSVNGNIPRNFLVFKVDPKGTKIWETIIDENYVDDLSSIVQLDNNKFIVSGNTTLDSGTTYPFVAILNTGGTVLFKKSYPENKNQKIYGIEKLENENILLLGEEVIQNSDSTSALILNIDQSGNINWEKQFTGAYKQHFKTSLKTKNGIILGGSKANSTYEGLDYSCWLVKIDSTGQIIWDNTIGGSEVNEIKKIQNDQFMIAANGYRKGGLHYPGGDVYVAKVDYSGELIWSEYYDNTRFDKGNSIIQLNDRHYRVFGEAREDPGRAEILIIDIKK